MSLVRDAEIHYQERRGVSRPGLEKEQRGSVVPVWGGRWGRWGVDGDINAHLCRVHLSSQALADLVGDGSLSVYLDFFSGVMVRVGITHGMELLACQSS